MFILSYLRKKQTNTVKQDTLENLDDDFIVITDNLRDDENNKPSFSVSVSSLAALNPKGCVGIPDDDKRENVKNIDDLKINNNSIEYVNEENNEVNLDTFASVNYDTSFSASGLRPDEENQLIENTKDVHCKKLSICNKITLLAKMLLKKLVVVLYKNNNI